MTMYAYSYDDQLIGGCKMKSKVDVIEWLWKHKDIAMYCIYKGETIYHG